MVSAYSIGTSKRSLIYILMRRLRLESNECFRARTRSLQSHKEVEVSTPRLQVNDFV